MSVSLLDDARQLAEQIPIDITGRGTCVFCRHDDRFEEPHDESHKPDCPWLALHRIVAALEAAEGIFEDMYKADHREPGKIGVYTSRAAYDALVAALRAEVAPSIDESGGTTVR